jgi:hypothetical protein
MKKKILLLSIALTSLTAFSFAADGPAVSKNVLSSFNQQFSSARDIKWDFEPKYVKAQFTMNDMVLFAYFNDNGELLAVTRFISTSQLPLSLLSNLKKEFNGYWVSDLFEIQTESGTSYYATLENADQVIVVKSEGTNGWNMYKKEKRENAQ